MDAESNISTSKKKKKKRLRTHERDHARVHSARERNLASQMCENKIPKGIFGWNMGAF